MNIIILQPSDKIDNNVYSISDHRFEHLREILKSEANDVVEIGLLNGPLGKAEIAEMNESEAVLKIKELETVKPEPITIDLICALPRPQTLKKVLHTAAVMGVRNLYLIRSEKVEKSYFHSPLLNENNLSKHLIEGLSQGKRTAIPTVTIHDRFKRFFEEELSLNTDSIGLLADPSSTTYLSVEMINSSNNIVIAIGPEGGWNDFEIELMRSKGFRTFKLSESIMRVENAVTAALAQVELVKNR